MKRVILHIGPSKTGTTTIQALLSEHSALLLEHMILYPSTNPPSNEGHPSLALEIRTACGEMVPSTTTPLCSWDEVICSFENSDATSLLISSEDFSDLNSRHWNWMREKLKSYEIWIVLAIRNPADVVFSAWKQSVKWGFGSGEEILTFDVATDLLMSLQRVEIFELVDCIEKNLKPAEIGIFTIRPGLDPADLYQRFASAANFPDIITRDHDQPIARSFNESFSDWKTMLLLQLNQAFYAYSPEEMTFPGNIGAKRLQLRSYILEALKDTPDVPEFKLPMSNCTIDKLDNLQQRIIDWAGRRELHGELSDISQSVRLKKSGVSSFNLPMTPPNSIDAINLLYKSLHNQVEFFTRTLNNANEFGSSQSKQVIKLIAYIADLENRLSGLADTLSVANKYGARQSTQVQSLVAVVNRLENQIRDMDKNLKEANDYGLRQSVNAQNLMKLLAEKDRQILELKNSRESDG